MILEEKKVFDFWDGRG